MAKKAFLLGAQAHGLSYTGRDLVLVREALEAHGFECDEVHGPMHVKKNYITDAFERFARNVKAVDTVVFYYSGHATIDRPPLQLLLGEAPEDEVRFEYFRDPFDRSHAQSKLIVLDCCHSGAAVADWKPAEPERFRILTASGRREVAKEIGDLAASFLTYHLHRLLTRDVCTVADTDGRVFLDSVYKKLKCAANQHNARPNPIPVPVPNLHGNAGHNLELGAIAPERGQWNTGDFVEHRRADTTGHPKRRYTSDWGDGRACLDELLTEAPNVLLQIQAKLEHVFGLDELVLPAADTLGARLFAAVAIQPYKVVLALRYALDELSAEDVRMRPFQCMLELLLPRCATTAARVERGKGFDHATTAATLLQIESEVARLTQRRAYPKVIGEKVMPAHGIEVDAAEGGIEDEDQLVIDVRALLADQLLGKQAQAVAASEFKQIDRDLRRIMRKHGENVRYQPQTYEQTQHNRYLVAHANKDQSEDQTESQVGQSLVAVRKAFPHLGVVLRAMDADDCDAQEDLADRVYDVLDKEASLEDRKP